MKEEKLAESRQAKPGRNEVEKQVRSIRNPQEILNKATDDVDAELKKAILKDFQMFMLEFGVDFALVVPQEGYGLVDEGDGMGLLFYNRALRRLVAIELKIGSFETASKAQMEHYLDYLEEYERKPEEEGPVGVIICLADDLERVQLQEVSRGGICGAQWWSVLPSRALFEQRIRATMAKAQGR